MFSICGLVCRIFRGWRQTEAATYMIHAVSQPGLSLLIEDVVGSTTGQCIRCVSAKDISTFCFDDKIQVKKQTIWNENNKQASFLSPKRTVDLSTWNAFSVDSKNLFEKKLKNSSQNVAVLLETSLKKRKETETENFVLVEQFLYPLLWRISDVFGIIAITTPSKLMSMVKAYFNNELIFAEYFCITRILNSPVDDAVSLHKQSFSYYSHSDLNSRFNLAALSPKLSTEYNLFFPRGWAVSGIQQPSGPSVATAASLQDPPNNWSAQQPVVRTIKLNRQSSLPLEVDSSSVLCSPHLDQTLVSYSETSQFCNAACKCNSAKLCSPFEIGCQESFWISSLSCGIVTQEPKKYFWSRGKSEGDLSKATSLIRSNLTNIIQSYFNVSSRRPIQSESVKKELQVVDNNSVSQINEVNEEPQEKLGVTEFTDIPDKFVIDSLECSDAIQNTSCQDSISICNANEHVKEQSLSSQIILDEISDSNDVEYIQASSMPQCALLSLDESLNYCPGSDNLNTNNKLNFHIDNNIVNTLSEDCVEMHAASPNDESNIKVDNLFSSTSSNMEVYDFIASNTSCTSEVASVILSASDLSSPPVDTEKHSPCESLEESGFSSYREPCSSPGDNTLCVVDNLLVNEGSVSLCESINFTKDEVLTIDSHDLLDKSLHDANKVSTSDSYNSESFYSNNLNMYSNTDSAGVKDVLLDTCKLPTSEPFDYQLLQTDNINVDFNTDLEGSNSLGAIEDISSFKDETFSLPVESLISPVLHGKLMLVPVCDGNHKQKISNQSETSNDNSLYSKSTNQSRLKYEVVEKIQSLSVSNNCSDAGYSIQGSGLSSSNNDSDVGSMDAFSFDIYNKDNFEDFNKFFESHIEEGEKKGISSNLDSCLEKGAQANLFKQNNTCPEGKLYTITNTINDEFEQHIFDGVTNVAQEPHNYYDKEKASSLCLHKVHSTDKNTKEENIAVNQYMTKPGDMDTTSSTVDNVESVSKLDSTVKTHRKIMSLGGSCDQLEMMRYDKKIRGSFQSSKSEELAYVLSSSSASLKSQDSFDSFPHFDAVSLEGKSIIVSKKYTKETARHDGEHSLHRSVTSSLASLIGRKEGKKSSKKKKKKNENKGDEKKSHSTINSIKDFLKRSKSKEKVKDVHNISSPKISISSHIKDATLSKQIPLKSSASNIVSGSLTVEKGINSVDQSIDKSSDEKQYDSLQCLPSLANLQSHVPKPVFSQKNTSPHLYHKVLTHNFSGSSQESATESNSPFSSPQSSPKHRIVSSSPSCYSLPISNTLSKAKKSLSITIGFKPVVQKSDIDECSQSSMGRRSSSMEILVCGKIKEKGKKLEGLKGSSRVGSFKLHREISIETLVEYPENIQSEIECTNKFNLKHDSSSSFWSLCDSASSNSSHLHNIMSLFSRPRRSINKKFSLPFSTHLSGTSISSSNPNLHISPVIKEGIPLSSSFTNSPFHRPHSAMDSFSPAKINCTTEEDSGNDAPCNSPLENVEEEECSKHNVNKIVEKPPNIIIYSANNEEYFNLIKETISQCINYERFLLQGGHVLSICSDFLNVAIPLIAFQLPWTSKLVASGSVEGQSDSLISLTFDRWAKVLLPHHPHCIHSSPLRKIVQDTCSLKYSRSVVSVEPTSIEIKDECGKHHALKLKVLASNDICGTPLLMSATVSFGKGKAVFSQVHLEQDPRYEAIDECCFEKSNKARLEILRCILSSELSIDTSNYQTYPQWSYSAAYLLGDHKRKAEFLSDISSHLVNHKLKLSKIELQFFSQEDSAEPSETYLPVLTVGCPKSFSTVKYYEVLKTSHIGRLVIFSDTLGSTMNVVTGGTPLSHGLAVIAMQQTSGKGRSGNLWLSIFGCALFSVQLHITSNSHIGHYLSFVQHLVALAVVKAVRNKNGYENIPLFLKWPNDIYIGDTIKIGGVIVASTSVGQQIILSIGCGVNLSNSNPTTCINDAIKKYNLEHNSCLNEFLLETFLASVFTELEFLICKVQTNGVEAAIPDYYKFWLHSDAIITVQNEFGHQEQAFVTGIDNYGFLEARLKATGKKISLHPDGNSFDLMKGLVYV